MQSAVVNTMSSAFQLEQCQAKTPVEGSAPFTWTDIRFSDNLGECLSTKPSLSVFGPGLLFEAEKFSNFGQLRLGDFVLSIGAHGRHHFRQGI